MAISGMHFRGHRSSTPMVEFDWQDVTSY